MSKDKRVSETQNFDFNKPEEKEEEVVLSDRAKAFADALNLGTDEEARPTFEVFNQQNVEVPYDKNKYNSMKDYVIAKTRDAQSQAFTLSPTEMYIMQYEDRLKREDGLRTKGWNETDLALDRYAKKTGKSYGDFSRDDIENAVAEYEEDNFAYTQWINKNYIEKYNEEMLGLNEDEMQQQAFQSLQDMSNKELKDLYNAMSEAEQIELKEYGIDNARQYADMMKVTNWEMFSNLPKGAVNGFINITIGSTGTALRGASTLVSNKQVSLEEATMLYEGSEELQNKYDNIRDYIANEYLDGYYGYLTEEQLKKESTFFGIQVRDPEKVREQRLETRYALADKIIEDDKKMKRTDNHLENKVADIGKSILLDTTTAILDFTGGSLENVNDAILSTNFLRIEGNEEQWKEKLGGSEALTKGYSFGVDLTQGLGSVAGFMAMSYIGQGLGVNAGAMETFTLAQQSLSMGQEAYDTVIANGGTINEAYGAMYKAGGLNTLLLMNTGALPDVSIRALKQFNAGNIMKAYITNATKEGFEEAMQYAIEQYAIDDLKTDDLKPMFRNFALGAIPAMGSSYMQLNTNTKNQTINLMRESYYSWRTQANVNETIANVTEKDAYNFIKANYPNVKENSTEWEMIEIDYVFDTLARNGVDTSKIIGGAVQKAYAENLIKSMNKGYAIAQEMYSDVQQVAREDNLLVADVIENRNVAKDMENRFAEESVLEVPQIDYQRLIEDKSQLLLDYKEQLDKVETIIKEEDDQEIVKEAKQEKVKLKKEIAKTTNEIKKVEKDSAKSVETKETKSFRQRENEISKELGQLAMQLEMATTEDEAVAIENKMDKLEDELKTIDASTFKEVVDTKKVVKVDPKPVLNKVQGQNKTTVTNLPETTYRSLEANMKDERTKLNQNILSNRIEYFSQQENGMTQLRELNYFENNLLTKTLVTNTTYSETSFNVVDKMMKNNTTYGGWTYNDLVELHKQEVLHHKTLKLVRQQMANTDADVEAKVNGLLRDRRFRSEESRQVRIDMAIQDITGAYGQGYLNFVTESDVKTEQELNEIVRTNKYGSIVIKTSQESADFTTINNAIAQGISAKDLSNDRLNTKLNKPLIGSIVGKVILDRKKQLARRMERQVDEQLIDYIKELQEYYDWFANSYPMSPDKMFSEGIITKQQADAIKDIPNMISKAEKKLGIEVKEEQVAKQKKKEQKEKETKQAVEEMKSKEVIITTETPAISKVSSSDNKIANEVIQEKQVNEQLKQMNVSSKTVESDKQVEKTNPSSKEIVEEEVTDNEKHYKTFNAQFKYEVRKLLSSDLSKEDSTKIQKETLQMANQSEKDKLVVRYPKMEFVNSEQVRVDSINKQIEEIQNKINPIDKLIVETKTEVKKLSEQLKAIEVSEETKTVIDKFNNEISLLNSKQSELNKQLKPLIEEKKQLENQKRFAKNKVVPQIYELRDNKPNSYARDTAVSTWGEGNFEQFVVEFSKVKDNMFKEEVAPQVESHVKRVNKINEQVKMSDSTATSTEQLANQNMMESTTDSPILLTNDSFEFAEYMEGVGQEPTYEGDYLIEARNVSEEDEVVPYDYYEDDYGNVYVAVDDNVYFLNIDEDKETIEYISFTRDNVRNLPQELFDSYFGEGFVIKKATGNKDARTKKAQKLYAKNASLLLDEAGTFKFSFIGKNSKKAKLQDGMSTDKHGHVIYDNPLFETINEVTKEHQDIEQKQLPKSWKEFIKLSVERFKNLDLKLDDFDRVKFGDIYRELLTFIQSHSEAKVQTVNLIDGIYSKVRTKPTLMTMMTQWRVSKTVISTYDAKGEGMYNFVDFQEKLKTKSQEEINRGKQMLIKSLNDRVKNHLKVNQPDMLLNIESGWELTDADYYYLSNLVMEDEIYFNRNDNPVLAKAIEKFQQTLQALQEDYKVLYAKLNPTVSEEVIEAMFPFEDYMKVFVLGVNKEKIGSRSKNIKVKKLFKRSGVDKSISTNVMYNDAMAFNSFIEDIMLMKAVDNIYNRQGYDKRESLVKEITGNLAVTLQEIKETFQNKIMSDIDALSKEDSVEGEYAGFVKSFINLMKQSNNYSLQEKAILSDDNFNIDGQIVDNFIDKIKVTNKLAINRLFRDVASDIDNASYRKIVNSSKHNGTRELFNKNYTELTTEEKRKVIKLLNDLEKFKLTSSNFIKQLKEINTLDEQFDVRTRIFTNKVYEENGGRTIIQMINSLPEQHILVDNMGNVIGHSKEVIESGKLSKSYSVQSMYNRNSPDTVATNFINEMLMNLTEDEYATNLVLSGQARVVPKELSDTIGTLRTPVFEGQGMMKALSKLTNVTKKYMLFGHPLFDTTAQLNGRSWQKIGAVRYNVKALVSDNYRVLQTNPKAMLQVPKAIKILSAYYLPKEFRQKINLTQEESAFLMKFIARQGGQFQFQTESMGIDYGDAKKLEQAIEEMESIAKNGVSPSNVYNLYRASRKVMNFYMGGIADVTAFREGILRMAYALDVRQDEMNGKEPAYGASLMESVKKMPDADERALTIAHQNFIAYNELPRKVKWLNSTFQPFITFQVGNALWHKRFWENTIRQIGTGLYEGDFKKAGLATGKGTFAMLMQTGIYQTLWNAVMRSLGIGDDDEEIQDYLKDKVSPLSETKMVNKVLGTIVENLPMLDGIDGIDNYIILPVFGATDSFNLSADVYRHLPFATAEQKIREAGELGKEVDFEVGEVVSEYLLDMGALTWSRNNAIIKGVPEVLVGYEMIEENMTGIKDYHTRYSMTGKKLSALFGSGASYTFEQWLEHDYYGIGQEPESEGYESYMAIKNLRYEFAESIGKPYEPSFGYASETEKLRDLWKRSLRIGDVEQGLNYMIAFGENLQAEGKDTEQIRNSILGTLKGQTIMGTNLNEEEKILFLNDLLENVENEELLYQAIKYEEQMFGIYEQMFNETFR